MYIILFVMAGAIIALDQWTKGWIRTNIEMGEVWYPITWLAPFVKIVHWYNTGVAFGLFQGVGQVFMVLSFIVALIIIYYFPRVPAGDWPLQLAMGMQLGGALGNLVDRITIGHVTDFISIGTFPVFNVADSSISVGVVILVLGIWIQEQKDRKNNAGLQPEVSGEPRDDSSETL
jgi:signal peptidase II